MWVFEVKTLICNYGVSKNILEPEQFVNPKFFIKRRNRYSYVGKNVHTNVGIENYFPKIEQYLTMSASKKQLSNKIDEFNSSKNVKIFVGKRKCFSKKWLVFRR